jgi:trigger factor
VELSSENLFEEFRSGLTGRSAGDEIDIEVKYPPDFPDGQLAGKTKRFHVKVVEVQERLLPELDDNFAKRLNSEVDSLDELKKRIREDLEHEEGHRFDHDVEEKAVDRLIEKNSFDIPEVMVENYLQSVLEEDRRRRPQVPDEAAREREVREAFREAAERSIRKYFILDAVARQESIRAGAEDVEARVAAMAKETDTPEEQVRGYLAHPERRRRLESDIVDRKVLDLIRGRTQVKEPS